MSNAMTLERLQVVMEANTKQFTAEIKKVQSQVKTMTDSVNKEVGKVKSIIGTLGTAFVALQIGKYIGNSVQSAMQVEGALQQVARTMGESTNSFLKWAQTSALSFNMAQSDAIKFGATYSNLVSTFAGDTETVTSYTTELLKASSIIASGTGRTMEDVMERIRSGLLGNTEAIEDLGIHVNVAMLESTEAFNRFANGKSWDQLDYQTQQQIRLFSILEQTSSKFGGEVFQNTNSSLQQLVAILKDVALNIGNAFLPIINVVIPILSSMAMWLRTVTSYFATFMQTLFGYKPKTSTGISGSANSAIGGVNNLGDALASTGAQADSAKKKVGGLLGGFDEINTLNQTSDSSGTGGSGVGGVGNGTGGSGFPSLDVGDFEEPDTSGIEAAAKKVRETVKGVVDFVKEHKVIIISVIAGLAAGIVTYMGITAIGGVGVLSTAFGLLPIYIAGACAGVLASVSAVASAIFSPVTAIASLIASIVAAFVYLWQTSDTFRQSLIDGWNSLVSAVTPYFNAFKDLFMLIVDAIATFVTPILVVLWDLIVTVVDNVVQVVMAFWNNVLAPFIQFFGELVGAFVDGLADIWEAWKPTFEKMMGIVLKIWDEYLKPFIDWIGTIFINAFEKAGDFLAPIFENIKTMFKGLIEFVVGIFTGDWDRAIAGIKDVFEGYWNYIKYLATSVWDGIKGVWNGAKNWFNDKVVKPISNFFTGMWDKVKEKAKSTWTWITDLFAKGGKIFSGITEGIVGAFKSIVNALIGGINKIIASPFRTINGLLNTIRSIEVMGMKPFSGMWGYNPLPVPQIPKLARGGVVDSATLAIIGEAGKEAVVPLENNTGWMSKMASMLVAQMPQGSGNNDSGSGDLILMIDGAVIGKVALQQLRKMQRQGNVTLIPT